MTSGALPARRRQRTNAPTIPTTNLPASGRKGRIPKVPEWVVLGDAGLAWWRWAWRTPQSAAWADGCEVALSRRAALEDLLSDLAAVRNLAPVLAQALKLDEAFGLTPYGMARLRWELVDDSAPDVAAQAPAPVVAAHWRSA